MTARAESISVEMRNRCVGPPAALAVDLDGTLVKTDLLLESVLAMLKQAPWRLFWLPVWLLHGRAHLQQQLARRVALEVKFLPYRTELLQRIQAERDQGRAVALVTSGDMVFARRVAEHLRLFDSVIASDGARHVPLHEPGAGIRLEARTGPARPMDRELNSPTSPASGSVVRENLFEERGKPLTDRVRALRLEHWLKNFLVFVPLLAAHRLGEAALLGKVFLAFLAFGCITSSGYLFNDLVDLTADRRHPNKRYRPFASGDLPLSYAFGAIPFLVVAACVIGSRVSGLFLASVLTYLVLTLTYSLYLKQIALLDVIVLAALYTLRILAGSAAAEIWPSHWLLVFSALLFLSLALVKRYGELAVMRRIDGDGARARAYQLSDGELLAAMGVASGYLAVLALAFYISREAAQVLVRRFELMWLLCPLLLYWISHVWLIAHRGQMPDDPVLFAVTDRTSRIVGLLLFAVCMLAV